MKNEIFLSLPLIIGYLGASLCKMPSSDNLKGRPPGFVFGIIWPILYLIIGYTWTKEQRNEINIVYSINLLLSFLWQYFFSCKKKSAILIIRIIINVNNILYDDLY